MGGAGATQGERVVDVREIDPRVRHTIIHQLFEHLPAGRPLQLIVDHDPSRLRLQLEAGYAGSVGWTYLERGPDIWRVRIERAGAT